MLIAGPQVLYARMACVHAPRPRDDSGMFSLDEIHQISLCPAVNSVNSSTLLRHCGHGKGGDRDTQRSGTGGVAGGSSLRCGGEGTQRRAQAQLPYDVVLFPCQVVGDIAHVAVRSLQFHLGVC